MAIASAKPTEQTPPPEVQAVARSKPRRNKQLWDSLKAYAFIAPALIILFVFHFFPIIYAFFLSLYQRISVVKGLIPPSENFAGFANYTRLISDPEWWNSFFNTLGYATGVVVVGLSAALGVALLLDKVKKGKEIYRVAFFVPYVTSLVAVATVWQIIFAPDRTSPLQRVDPNRPGGLVNWVFGGFNIPMQRWLLDDRGIFTILFQNGNKVDSGLVTLWLLITAGLIFGANQANRRLPEKAATWLSGILAALATITGWAAVVEIAHLFTWKDWWGGPSLAMVCVIIIAVWHSLGFNIIIILAGLTNISRELYEAAKLDGARGWSMLTKMTVPLLSPTLFFLLITTTISAFQAFTLFYALFPNRGGKSTEVLSIFYYDVTFQRGSGSDTSGFGYSSTIVIFMLILIVGINQLQQRLLSKKVNYD